MICEVNEKRIKHQYKLSFCYRTAVIVEVGLLLFVHLYLEVTVSVICPDKNTTNNKLSYEFIIWTSKLHGINELLNENRCLSCKTLCMQ